MGTKNEIKGKELTRVSGGNTIDGNSLNVLKASQWLMRPENYYRLSPEDQAAFSAHLTAELWLETFLYSGAISGNPVFIEALEYGMS